MLAGRWSGGLVVRGASYEGVAAAAGPGGPPASIAMIALGYR
jgi:hypothetical protein